MKSTARALLRDLCDRRGSFGPEAARTKLALVKKLARARLASAEDVLTLHETLLFLRAYPDDEAVLEAVMTTLRGFHRRGDFGRVRHELANSGIQGCEIRFPCWWVMASWLATQWPEQLSLDWEAFDKAPHLDRIWHLLLPHSETPLLDEYDRSPRDWIDSLRGPSESDAVFLIRRFAALDAGEVSRETLYDNFDVPLRLRADTSAEHPTPSRTLDHWPCSEPHFQRDALDRGRPDLHQAMLVAPVAVRRLSVSDGQRLVDLARSAMLTRSRDLDAFANADPRDARWIDCGDGLAFGMLGLRPERRLMLDSSYGLITFSNGLPIGYVLISALFGSAAIAYNVFEAFRGGEAAHVLGRVLAVARHVFGVDAVSIDPYQLGHGNEEGLRSGAWWFYYKLGFRPMDPGVKKVLRRELQQMKRDPGHRSSLETMRELVVDTMHFHLGPAREDVVGIVSLGEIGAAISELLAQRFGSDRETGLDTCEREAMKLCGLESLSGCTAGERLWWRRWSPLVLALPGVGSWPIAERRRLADVVKAKGGRHESDFVPLCDGHARLRAALLELALGGR